MASAPFPYQAEDQTDEAFFDQLVDDEFGIGGGSASGAGDMARVLSNASIGDLGGALVEEEEAGGVFGSEDGHEGSAAGMMSENSGKGASVAEESTAPVTSDSSFSFEKVVPCEDHHVENEPAVESIGSPGLVTGKSGKGTSVKVVQWTAFSGGSSEEADLGGFGSYSDFFPEVSSESSAKEMASSETSGRAEESNVNDLSAYFSSMDLQGGQEINEHVAHLSSTQQQDGQATLDANDPSYWDNLYPSWKYDFNTGQWYHVDNYDSTSNAQLNGYGQMVANAGESSQDMTQLADDKVQPVGDEVVFPDQIPDVSYLQQTSPSVVESIAEGYTTGNVSNWNQVSQGSVEYPPNMVFDPQYPGWYYDTNTQQWHSLECYTQPAAVMTTGTDQNVLASDSYFSEENQTSFNNEANQFGNQTLPGQTSEELGGDWNGSLGNYPQQNVWQSEAAQESSYASFSGNQQTASFYGSKDLVGNHVEAHNHSEIVESVLNRDYGNNNGVTAFQGFIPAQSMNQVNQPKVGQVQQTDSSQIYYGNQAIVNYSQQPFQNGGSSHSQFSYAPKEGRLSSGRPPHALVTFGFGGKLIIMKNTSSGTNLAYGSQDVGIGTISILNLGDVVIENSDRSDIGLHTHPYFHSLCKQSFPGPLVGGNAASKDINKWIDERIASCESSSMDLRKGGLLRLLLSLLKISCQYYGKLRSPFGTDPSSLETDSPESAVTKLFASAKKDVAHLKEYGAFAHCMLNFPAEGQMRATAAEVQNLLVSGKRKEALHCAQEGLLWGPALVLAAQLGEKFYVDTVKQMAHRQFVPGSPLRTLCLLIAGQPADVFSDGSSNSLSNSVNVPQQSCQALASGMLDDWEENLAVITANRTKDDELVIVHLGDCLWKERGEITAAHTCYLVAEANFESYSGSARLCLIGADHWKCPRTYASPEAIQRTEIYEYSKVLANSQFQLLTFQPYKLIYAHMLAEVGKVSDSLRYCQATLKLLKNSGRSPETEMWKLVASSLEERLRMHQQGGYGNSAPAKLVGKLFTSLDKSIHRMIGAPPTPLPPMPENRVQGNEYDNFPVPQKVGSSQSTMAISSLMPSASQETISDWTGDNQKNMQNRSVSEPDFGRSPRQVNPSSNASSTDMQSKASNSGGSSRFGLFGSTLLQKTMGWVSRSRPDRQAKLGEKNKFYYDEKLKRWVEEGAEPPPEEAALPAPPSTASFQNGVSDYNINSAFKTQNFSANGGMDMKPPTSSQLSSGIPPIPPSQNQFSLRGRMGVRSRYVDTFNKGGGVATSSFQSPSAPSVKPAVKPAGGAKFFVPTPVASSESTTDATESLHEASSNKDASSAVVKDNSFSSLSSSSSSYSLQRFPSMDNITPLRNREAKPGMENGNGSLTTRTRAASWSGSFSDQFNPKTSSFMSDNPSLRHRTGGSPTQVNRGNFGDDLHEVEL